MNIYEEEEFSDASRKADMLEEMVRPVAEKVAVWMEKKAAESTETDARVLRWYARQVRKMEWL